MKKSSQKVGIGSAFDDPGARTRLRARIAARLQFLDDDPLDFWDYGMLCAFEIVEARIQEMIKEGRERMKLSDLLKIVVAERAQDQAEDATSDGVAGRMRGVVAADRAQRAGTGANLNANVNVPGGAA